MKRQRLVNGKMPAHLSLCLLVCLPVCCFCQLGLNVRYQIGQSDILEANRIGQNGVQGSIEYHFRLKENRVEFHPGIGYRTTFNQSGMMGYFSSFDLDLATSIYPFDFEGDCNCPTFSKDGEVFKKGFFFELIPGIGYQLLKRIEAEPSEPENLPIKTKNVVFKLGGAAGLDLGFSDHFTMTPMISATFVSAEDWNGLNLDGSGGKLDDYMYLGFGLRFTYHSDDRK